MYFPLRIIIGYWEGLYSIRVHSLKLLEWNNTSFIFFYKLQPYRTGAPESEFCMGGQIRIDNLPYKRFIPVLSCTKE